MLRRLAASSRRGQRRRLSSTVALNANEVPSMKTPEFRSSPRPPLVVMHGLLGSLSNFRRLAATPELGTDRRVIVVDLRNHGASPHAGSMDLSAMAGDVWRLLDDRDIPEATILGHSLGARVAMTAALERPDRVAGLVAVDMAPVQYAREFTYRDSWDSVPRIVDAMIAVDMAAVDSRETADAMLREAVPDTAVRNFVMQNLAPDRSVSPPTWRWRANLATIRAEMDAMFRFDAASRAPFEGPALFVSGARSGYVTDEHTDEIRRLFPRAELQRVEGAGHWVHAERPKEFLAAVGRFLGAGDA